ncbi:uncharacterized protein LAESUDRAFT_812541 [Laetiporus sulphureus 93-53]|uniref:Uncharacterized protein n=1 Tax=Laetiporus sulphureus 93-53 TaxID=1314785 RepID=A0A165EEI1_9APHY|nr:uncharacterized protein LAESUDRAFT_812541 [Laetiporus sulphureus 93-53]KZT06879.1 hypothetical protein LAESUDRAFT_812541 [Laetiporus sulphureus 93-53]
MASVDTDNHKQDEIETALQSDTAVDNLADAVAQIAVLEDTETSDHSTHESPGRNTRPFRSYTRAQILYLAYSPLVQPPHDMPPLKEWFGDWHEQLITAKKDPETSGTSLSARDRRFRRDLDDGENPKQSFRATLSQPSQMGNFRHQSLRTNDRDKDKDLERERERDLRDKEGQERLRNLSDKYDRDRLALSASSNIRTKERDSAPHLVSGATSRLGQTQNSSSTSRRNETRDVPKRKIGESSEDWRRGSEPARSGRDDRSDNSRRDRERPRSRARESSRTRREPSSTRRDRDERDRERERLRDRRGDGDRDDLRRDKEEYSRRERDDSRRREWDDFYNRSDRDREDVSQRDSRGRYRPKDSERDSEEDPRRWNDDGKRDERIATRRERERERVWDRYDERDRERPNGSDDRDTRSRRGVGRERRPGGAGDDSKDNDDRRDRNREAEPAWMETYVPSTSGGGILGGKSGDGELDGIQAWKKGMKEKERLQRENSASLEATQKPEAKQASSASTAASQDSSNTPENQLDEIQIFKQMMKREADKKENEKQSTASPEPGPQMGPALSRAQSFASAFMLEQLTTGNDERAASNSHPSQGTAESQQSSNGRSRVSSGQQLPAGLSSLSRLTISQGEGRQSFMSVLASSASRESASPTNLGNTTIQSAERSSDGQQPIVSHVTPSIPSATVSSSQLSDFASLETSASASSAASVFNPPPGSRLLAFGSRSAPGPDALSSKLQPTLDSSISQLPPPGLPGLTAQKSTAMPPSMPNLSLLAESAGLDAHFVTNAKRTPTDSVRGFRSFSPHGNLVSSSATFEHLHEEISIEQLNDLRRASAVERAAFGLPNETVAPYAEMAGTQGGPASYSPSNSVELGGNIPGAANYASGKGSRFAKFFDSKVRDATLVGGGRKAPGPPGYVSNSPHPDLRQPGVGLNGTNGTPGDTRTMEDIFAMLQNSAQQQSHRVSPQIPSAGRMASIAYGQNHPDLHNLQQPIHSQHQFAQNSQFDSLYDSRLDDRNFVPDGMVPGLRPAPPRSRSREASGVLFNEQLDDPLHFNVRLQQQRNLEQMFSGSVSSVYSQQQAAMMRNGGLPLQQPQFRGAPSPILNQNPLGPQRLPPGLANLGGRPPHDPSQYLGGPMGGLGGGLQSGLHSGATAGQQSFNNYGGNGGALGFVGGPQIRSPSGPQGPLAVNSMAGLGIQNNMDLRAANQAHLLGLSGGSVGGGLRGQGPGFGPHHVPSGQPSVSHLAMRQQQQQQQQLPPHLMSHLLPPHLQQQQGLPGGNVQGAQDLMALLMGGHRD